MLKLIWGLLKCLDDKFCWTWRLPRLKGNQGVAFFWKRAQSSSSSEVPVRLESNLVCGIRWWGLVKLCFPSGSAISKETGGRFYPKSVIFKTLVRNYRAKCAEIDLGVSGTCLDVQLCSTLQCNCFPVMGAQAESIYSANEQQIVYSQNVVSFVLFWFHVPGVWSAENRRHVVWSYCIIFLNAIVPLKLLPDHFDNCSTETFFWTLRKIIKKSLSLKSREKSKQIRLKARQF